MNLNIIINMKKLIILVIGLTFMSTIYAQNISDALRYSDSEVQGTARFRALSGAFGALGGDMSAVSINPAGSAIFNSSHASISLSNNNKNNDVTYFNGFNNSSNSDIGLNQVGASIVLKNKSQNSDWNKIVFGFAYDRTNNYNNDWVATGKNSNSIDSYFMQTTLNQEIPLGILKLQPGEYIEEAYADIGANYGYGFQQAFLGYWAGIIDPVNMDNTTNDENIDYISNIASGNFDQRYAKSTTGYNGKFSINFATQYKEKLSLGINLNSHFIDYESYTGFSESNQNDGSLVNNVYFNNLLNTTGTGFSFQLGGILKITQELRAGLNYNSPTWYTISEELVQDINSNYADPEIGYIADITNIFPDYKIQTPSKLTGSLAYVFGKQGLISFDYSVKDYSKIKLKPTSDPDFNYQNNFFNNDLKSISIYRIGGEYKLNQFSFRGGYRMEESPYRNETTVGDLTGFSLGLGYSFGNTKLDLTFDKSERDTNSQLFDIGLTDPAKLNTENTNVTLSLSFNL